MAISWSRAASPLERPAELPLLQPDRVRGLESLLVVAPHPDDETLGCGGLIATARDVGLPVRVLFVTDGARSHPNSVAYPAARLRATREDEALAALRALGIPSGETSFLRYGDCAAPAPGHTEFPQAVSRVARLLADTGARTLLLPWRRDPHADHRATWRLAHTALAAAATGARVLEYPIWVWELGAIGDFPLAGEIPAWRLDIRARLPRKRTAIAAYRSQLGVLIDDDPTGFQLTPALLARFRQPFEVFLGQPPTLSGEPGDAG